jgi:hippurate hydrolase
MPHNAVDPVPVACEIVMALQAMVTRRIEAFDPIVLTVGRITSGTTNNIIPETAEIEGTIRSFSEGSRALAHEGLHRVAPNIAAAHKAEATVEIIPGFPVTICHGDAVALAKKTAQNLFGDHGWLPMPAPIMGAEDFAYVLQKVPGAMCFLGATPEGGDFRSCCALHSNRMVIDENVMARGAAMHAAYAEAFLNDGFEAA